MVISSDKTFGTCEYCGSVNTLPGLPDEQRAALFNRGNGFRRLGEFDAALEEYEHIIREDDTDAEAHWCCVLCRFGIEYVEDPASYEWVPTCHRASFDSFLEDVDYQAALEHSDGITRRLYQKEAAKIAEVQRRILATTQNEEPFDIFICYKELDDDTKQRTIDSTLAKDIYDQLTEQGYRVFCSQVTMKDKVGAEFEPYIFAALNSAKVMLTISTRPEYLNAVWVKNEWSRFTALRNKDSNKWLFPCYRDMDPETMPEQLKKLQSYDMGSIGFISNLARGISKVFDTNKKTDRNVNIISESDTFNVSALLKRVFIFLEDENWEKADEYCEKILDIDPENALGYVGKLMAELKVQTQEKLADCAEPFDDRNDYQKAIRFANNKLAEELKGYVSYITKRNAIQLAALKKKLLIAATRCQNAGQLEKARELYIMLSQKCPNDYDGWWGIIQTTPLENMIVRDGSIIDSKRNRLEYEFEMAFSTASDMQREALMQYKSKIPYEIDKKRVQEEIDRIDLKIESEKDKIEKCKRNHDLAQTKNEKIRYAGRMHAFGGIICAVSAVYPFVHIYFFWPTFSNTLGGTLLCLLLGAIGFLLVGSFMIISLILMIRVRLIKK